MKHDINILENPFIQPLVEILIEVKQKLEAIDSKLTPVQEEPDAHLTKAQLAHLFQCCEKTIDNYRAEGLPDLQNKKGRKLLFSKNAAIHFMKTKKIVSSRGANAMQQLSTHPTSD